MKELYDTTWKLAGKRKIPHRPIVDEEANTLTKQEDKLERWAEHFRELLNRPRRTELANIPPFAHLLQVNTNKQEIKKAIKKTKKQQSTRT